MRNGWPRGLLVRRPGHILCRSLWRLTAREDTVVAQQRCAVAGLIIFVTAPQRSAAPWLLSRVGTHTAEGTKLDKRRRRRAPVQLRRQRERQKKRAGRQRERQKRNGALRLQEDCGTGHLRLGRRRDAQS